ncbi:hypothetical protein QQE94_06190 [Fervidobacterium pennivorans subsp. shakshaketiis]|uniref:hypothetical protein n=1 Tax=Fervidobacterium pennivorans TaxID=93466 RepID=UPI00355BB7A3
MKKIFLLLYLMSIFKLLFAAPYNTTIRVLLWDDTLTQTIKKGLSDFEKATGIKVVLELLPNVSLPQRIRETVTLTKTDYDLVAIDEPFIPEFAHLMESFDKWGQGKVYKNLTTTSLHQTHLKRHNGVEFLQGYQSTQMSTSG